MSNHSLTKNSKIRIVELLAYQFGKLNGELCFDEYSSALSPSRATHTLEAILKYDG